MSKPRYPDSTSFATVRLGQIAGEINRTPRQTAKLLKTVGFIGLDRRRHIGVASITYDARALEVLKAMLDIPHRHLSDVADDWLSQWTNKGEKHGTN